MRTVGIVFVGLALLSTSCGGSSSGPPRTYTVKIDGASSTFNGVFPSFFPTEATVRQGDSIRFTLAAYHGEPHTVTLGKLVDSAAARLGALGPGASLKTVESTKEMLALPAVFPRYFSRLKGPPLVNLPAVQPCFLESDSPANSFTGGAPGCPQVPQPRFSGKQSFYNLGLFAADGESKTIRLADDIAPGSYFVMCLVHRSLMTTRIGVASKKKEIFTPAQEEKQASDQFASLLGSVSAAVPKLGKATPQRAVAGVAVPSVNGLVAQFAPPSPTIGAGETMAWTLTGTHSISFGIGSDAVGLVRKGSNGYELNEAAYERPGAGPPPPSSIDFPPPDTGAPVTYGAGTYRGSGVFSTGVIQSVAPVIVTVAITFSTPGTYEYRCVVHPAMKGRVTVR